MKRFIVLFVVCICTAMMLSAQQVESPEVPDLNIDFEPIRVGDQFIRIGLGLTLPMWIHGPDGFNSETNIFPGGTGYIGFTRYLTPRISLGGEVSFLFNATVGENMFFALPLLARISKVFVLKDLHFPISLGIGGAFQSYNNINYFGFAIKPEAGAWYQFTPEWSFGLSAGLLVLPQFYNNSDHNRTGSFLDVVASIRYHF